MGVGTISSKTVVGILSALFLAAAIGMWVMGGYVIATYRNVNTIASAYYTLVPAAVMIAVGIVFLLGAISGFSASCRESRCCSLTFFLFVFLTFALLITAIALAFVYKRQINEVVENESKKALQNYSVTGHESESSQIDYLQHTFTCCGSYNYTSWADTPFGKNHTNHVPVSCCKSKNTTSCFDGDLGPMEGKVSDYIYTSGCIGAVQEFLKSNLHYLGAGAVVFLVFLILGMVGSCIVLWKKNESPYLNLGS